MPEPNENAPRSEETRGGEVVAQESGNVTRTRDSRRGGWSWADKTALRRIREAFDASKNVASALAVYHALCEIASDEGADKFQTTHAWIATISGLSPRTVQDRVGELAELNFIEVRTPSLRAPSTYHLLSVRQPLPSAQQPLRSDTQRLIQAALPTSEERERNVVEERERTEGRVARATPASRSTSIDEAWLAELRPDAAFAGIEVDRELAKMTRWCAEHRKQPTRRRFINWLNRADRTISQQSQTPNHAGGF